MGMGAGAEGAGAAEAVCMMGAAQQRPGGFVTPGGR